MISRRSLALPLYLIAACGTLIILLMVGALPAPTLIAQVSVCPDPAYPNLSYDNCKRTQQAGTSSPAPTSTSGSSSGNQPPPVVNTATPTATRTVTATAATQAPSATLAASATPTATRDPASIPPTPTSGSLLPADVETLACVPGETLTLVGEARPGTALLAYFDDRPVGGGFARADGRFRIELLIGPERPGQYLVEVRERGSGELALQLGCAVPAFTPTPTPFIVP